MGTVLTVRYGSVTVGFTVRHNTTDVLNVHTQHTAAMLCCAVLSAVMLSTASCELSAAICCLPITMMMAI